MVTWLSIEFISKFYMLDIIDEKIPIPSDITSLNDKHVVTWCIDGYMGTPAGKEFFNDISQKICILLGGKPAKTPQYIPVTNNTGAFPTSTHTSFNRYKLLDFTHIRDNRYKRHTKVLTHTKQATDDAIFDALRKEAYILKKLGALTLERLDERLHTITDNYTKHKYKVRNIYEWVMINYTGTKIRTSIRNRTDNAQHQTKLRSKSKYTRFRAYIQFIGTDALNVSDIARRLSMTRKTVAKYIKIYYLNMGEYFIQHIRGKTFRAYSVQHKGVDTMPKKICNMPACNMLIDMKYTYCKEHGTKDTVYSKYTRDKDSAKFYNSTAWRKKRLEVMQNYNGLCQHCLANDKIVEADVVDHIREYKEYPALGLDNNNLEPLCHNCHNIKTNL